MRRLSRHTVGWRVARLSRRVVVGTSVLAGAMLATPGYAAFDDCRNRKVCLWESASFTGAPTWQRGMSLPTFKPILGLNDNVRAVRNRTATATYVFQNPNYRSDDGEGFFIELEGELVCVRAGGTRFPIPHNRSSMLLASDAGCFPSAAITQGFSGCRTGRICAYVDTGYDGPMVNVPSSDKDFRDNRGVNDSISSVSNRSSRAVYFFQNPRFGQDLTIIGADLPPYCVAAGARSASIGPYNDRFSSAIVSKSRRCEF